MITIDFTSELYLLGWGLVFLLVIAAAGIIGCLSREELTAQTWAETGDFVRSLRAANGGPRRSHRPAGRLSRPRSSVGASAGSPAARSA